MAEELIYEAADEAQTAALGHKLAEVLPDGAVVGLDGTLGAGKTRLVKAVAEACGVPPQDVSSPTFVLMQPYHGRRTLYHFDAYRIADEDEFLQLGTDEFFESPAISLVEWAQRVEGCLPAERFSVRIEVLDGTRRRFHLSAAGPRYAAAIRQLRDWIARRPITR